MSECCSNASGQKWITIWNVTKSLTAGVATNLVGDAGLAIRDECRVANDQAADLQPALAQDSQVAVPHILTACTSAT